MHIATARHKAVLRSQVCINRRPMPSQGRSGLRGGTSKVWPKVLNCARTYASDRVEILWFLKWYWSAASALLFAVGDNAFGRILAQFGQGGQVLPGCGIGVEPQL
jgi:hypothetical protein